MKWIGFPIRLAMATPFIVFGALLGILFWPDDIQGMTKMLWNEFVLLEREA